MLQFDGKSISSIPVHSSILGISFNTKAYKKTRISLALQTTHLGPTCRNVRYSEIRKKKIYPITQLGKSISKIVFQKCF